MIDFDAGIFVTIIIVVSQGLDEWIMEGKWKMENKK